MPQMSPMWWTTLTIIFLISLITMMNITYFNYKKKIFKNKFNKNFNMDWKW